MYDFFVFVGLFENIHFLLSLIKKEKKETIKG